MEQSQIPSIGRIVRYVLTRDDALYINTQRGNGTAPKGIQPSTGNNVDAGEHVAAIIVALWPGEYPDGSGVNLQCLLDGNDSYWATSRKYDEGAKPGTWHWPERV